ncbi:hypothetical protein K502DRAFT_338838 [Neoconidiobolus thromboides FSU 785]|nr:hypothetical protein K502DRAFT_338838 [Neoconidiobolus thromboides FSU 785]
MASEPNYYNDAMDIEDSMDDMPPYLREMLNDSSKSISGIYLERHDLPPPIPYSSPELGPLNTVTDSPVEHIRIVSGDGRRSQSAFESQIFKNEGDRSSEERIKITPGNSNKSQSTSALQIFKENEGVVVPNHISIHSGLNANGLEFMPPLPGVDPPTYSIETDVLNTMEQIVTRLNEFKSTAVPNLKYSNLPKDSIFSENDKGVQSDPLPPRKNQFLQLSIHDFDFIINFLNSAKDEYQKINEEFRHQSKSHEAITQLNWQLQDRISDLEKDNELFKERQVLLKSSLNDARSELNNRVKENGVNNGQEHQYGIAYQSSDERIAELEENINNLREENQNLGIQLSNINEENERIKESWSEDRESLFKKINELENINASLKYNNKILADSNSIIDKKTDKQDIKFKSQNKSKDNTHDEMEVLRKSITVLEEENQRLNKENNFSLLKQNSYYQQLNYFKEQKDSLEKELNRLKGEYEPENKARSILSQRNNYLEEENKELKDQVEVLKSQRESEIRNLLHGNAYQNVYSQNLNLKKELEDLTLKHSELNSQYRSLSSKTKAMDVKLNKAGLNYENLVKQDQVLTSKQKELQDSNKMLQDEITNMFNLKSELLKQRRALDMDIGSLKTIILSSGKKSIRTLPTGSNIFTEESNKQTFPLMSTPNKQRKSIAMINEEFNSKEKLESMTEKEESFNSSIFDMPSLSYLENDDHNLVMENLQLKDLNDKLLNSKSRVAELEILVQRLNACLDLKAMEIQRDNQSNSLMNSKSMANLARNIESLNKAPKGDEQTIKKIDDLCQLLTTHTQEFHQMIEAEKKAYFLMLEKENLNQDLEKRDQILEKYQAEIERLNFEMQKNKDEITKKRESLTNQEGIVTNEEYSKLNFKVISLNQEIIRLKSELDKAQFDKKNPPVKFLSSEDKSKTEKIEDKVKEFEKAKKVADNVIRFYKRQRDELVDINKEMFATLEKESNENKDLLDKVKHLETRISEEELKNTINDRNLEQKGEANKDLLDKIKIFELRLDEKAVKNVNDLTSLDDFKQVVSENKHLLDKVNYLEARINEEVMKNIIKDKNLEKGSKENKDLLDKVRYLELRLDEKATKNANNLINLADFKKIAAENKDLLDRVKYLELKLDVEAAKNINNITDLDDLKQINIALIEQSKKKGYLNNGRKPKALNKLYNVSTLPEGGNLLENFMNVVKSSSQLHDQLLQIVNTTQFNQELVEFGERLYMSLSSLKINDQYLILHQSILSSPKDSTPQLILDSKSSFTSQPQGPGSSIADEPEVYTYRRPYKDIAYKFLIESKYAKEKLNRERDFRLSLAFQKKYHSIIIRRFEKGEQRMIAHLRDMGFDADDNIYKPVGNMGKPSYNIFSSLTKDPPPSFSPTTAKARKKLRVCVVVIVFQIIAKKSALEWQKITNNYQAEKEEFDKNYPPLVA